MIFSYFKRKRAEAKAKVQEEKADAEKQAARVYRITFYNENGVELASKTRKGIASIYHTGEHYCITGQSILESWVGQYELGYPTDKEGILFNVHSCSYHKIVEVL